MIDFHTHPYLTSDENICFYKDEEGYNKDFEGQMADFAEREVDHICGSVIKRFEKVDSFESIRELNDHALLLAERSGGFYTPGLHIHPRFVRESLEELDRMEKKGLKLIGEIVPYMMDWGNLDERSFFAILEKANEMKAVFSYHTPWDYEMEKAVATFRDITFVAAHPGEKDRILRHVELLKKYDNYNLDLSGTGMFRRGMLAFLVREAGSERILYGSDYPICNHAMYENAWKGENLKKEDIDNIMEKNAKRILGI